MADRIGQQLGNYRLVRLLGRGGFAEVYLGQHVYLETQAAIKVLQTQLAHEDSEQFRIEAKRVAHLEHPHIVRVLDFGVEGTTPFLAMSYAPNGTLRQRHPKGTHLPLTVVVDYVKQIADALHYAHNQKLIHRDVKPENMLVGLNNDILLSDFGIAVAQTSRSQSTRDMAGTIAYMAPEQIEAHPRPASDQYSLGIVVYEWLSGDQPFHGSFTEIAVKHTMVPPPPLCEKLPTLSPAVEQVVMIALAKDPKQRFGSVQAFATALEQVSQVHPDGIVSPSQLRQPTKLVTRPSQSSRPTEMARSSPPSALPPGAIIPIQSRTSAASPQQSLPSTNPVTAQRPSFVVERSLGKLQPSQRGISRRTVVIGGLAGLAAVGVAGGGIAWLMHTQGPYVSSPTPNPTSPSSLRANPTLSSTSPVPSINSSGAMFGFDLQHTRFNPDEHILSPTNVSRLVQYWTASTGAFVFSSPAVANGVVYVSSDKLYALNASTGTLKWVYNTGGGGSSPAVANGVVYVGSGDYKLYALNASTGQTLWTSAPTGAGIISSPAVANGVVYVGSFDHKLYAFDASTGQTLWTSTPSGDRILSSPAVANGVVYVGSLDHKLYAFNASTGTILWTASTGDQIYSSPAIANGVVYVGSFDHTLHAFNASTGQTLWTSALTRAGIYSSPAVANGVVYAGSDDFALYAFNASTGTTIWTSAPTGAPINSSPAVTNGVVYVGSNDHKLYAFDATTGQTLWATSTDDLIISSPVVANGVVYVGSGDHKLYAFHLPGTTP
jgi:outer membrane protein assembly factor BamB/tRNA A-37 threonylcarbamoyl transferase component Bud32